MMEEYGDACLPDVVADLRRDIEADRWTAAYVRVLRLGACDRRSSCPIATECARVRDVFARNVERAMPAAKAAG